MKGSSRRRVARNRVLVLNLTSLSALLLVSLIALPSTCASSPSPAKSSSDLSNFWYGVGLDWKLYDCNPDNPDGTPLNMTDLIQGWNTTITNYLSKYRFNTVRLAFSFQDSGGNHTESILNMTELNAVLSLLSNNNMSVILDLHDWSEPSENWTEMQGFFGSLKWIWDWTQLANEYKNDSTIIAYEIFNEPSYDLGYWAPQVTGGGCGIPYTGDGESVQMALAECVDAIRSTGDNHTIVYPDPHYFVDNYTAELHPEWFYNSIYDRPNIVITFHDWFENASLQDPADFQAWWNGVTQVQSLWKAYFPIWIGEFGMSLAAQNQTMQTYVNTAILNWALNNNVGFNVWVTRSNPADEEQQWNMTESFLTSFHGMPGDVNGDFKVDMKDVAIVARAFGSTPSSSNWNPNADLNNDDKVDMKDIAIVVAHFGQQYP